MRVEVVLGHEEGSDAFGVVQVAARDSGGGIGEREVFEGNALVVFRRRGARVETDREVGMNLLGAETGRGEERTQRNDPVGGIAGLLGQFARGGSFRWLVRLARARWYFEEYLPDRMPPLPHKHDSSIIKERDERNRTGMHDDLAPGLAARDEADGVNAEREEFSLMHDFAVSGEEVSASVISKSFRRG